MINIRTDVLSLGVTLCGFMVLASSAAVAQDAAAAEKQAMIAKGLEHETAWDLYLALQAEADGGQELTWTTLPDWSGVFTRTRGGLNFDPDQLPDGLPTAKLTPEYHAAMMERIELTEQGHQFDPLGTCISPGHPRWLNLPSFREHIVTPEQTTMITEVFNSVRRIYTDGRDHLPEAERYPIHNGDSIGFWDGHRLVVHTNQLMAHYYERVQPDYSEQVETVEIWEQVDDRTLQVDVWIYDPPALVEPWYTRQSYSKLDDPEKILRIGHYDCKGNPNSDTYMTEEGGTQFTDLTFTDQDDR